MENNLVQNVSVKPQFSIIDTGIIGNGAMLILFPRVDTYVGYLVDRKLGGARVTQRRGEEYIDL